MIQQRTLVSAFLIFLLLLLPLEPAFALYTGGYIPNADIKKDPLQNVSDAFASGLSGTAPELGEHGYPLGDFKVDKLTGAATYSYPFSLPPGRKGLTPSIGLSYNSGNKNNFSPVGYGWELSAASITRSDRTGVNHLYDGTNEFQLNLFGESGELVPVSLVDATHGTYGKKIEDSFYRYEFLTNGSWVVTTQDGTQYTFGTNNTTRQYDPTTPSHIYKWMLEEVRDTNDNYIRFTYFMDSNQIYLSGIYYTGHGAASVLNDGPFTVDLTYENRIDAMVSYRTGFRVTTAKRLNTVTVSVDGEPSERMWELDYTTGDNTVRSLLSSITMSATNVEGDDVTLEPTTFEYSSSHPDGTVDWAEQAVPYTELVPVELIGLNSGDLGNMVMDANGDSWADLIASHIGLCTLTSSNYGNCSNLSTTNPDAYLNTHDTDVASNLWEVSPSHNYNLNLTQAERTTVVDLNGDALPDFYGDNIASDMDAYLGIGYRLNAGTAFGNNWASWFVPSAGGDYGYRYFDVNGDGWDDKVRHVTTGYAYSNPGGEVHFNDGELGFGSVPSGWTLPVPTGLGANSANGPTMDSGARFGDVNGDGLLDVIYNVSFTSVSWPSLNNSIQKVYLNNGQNGWTEEPGWPIPGNIFANITLQASSNLSVYTTPGTCFYDVNADGLLDLNTSSQAFNKGIGGWFYNVISTQNAPTCGSVMSYYGDSETQRTGDLNGDGFIDEIWTATTPAAPSHYSLSVESIPDLLIEIENPAGGLVEIAYTMSAEYMDSSSELLNPNLPMSMATVSQVIFDNDFGDNVITSYAYEDGHYYRYDLFRSEFAGFETVTETTGDQVVTYAFDLGCELGDTCSNPMYLPHTLLSDPSYSYFYVVDGNYKRAITNFSFISTVINAPFDERLIQAVDWSILSGLPIGAPWDQWTDTYMYEVDLTNYARKGKLLERQVSHTNGNVYAQESYDWEVADIGNGRFFPHLATEMEFLYNISYTSTRDKSIDYTYNTITGRVTQVKEWGQIDANPTSLYVSSMMYGDERTANTTYMVNSADWLVLPDTVTLLDENNAQISATDYDYDAAGNLVDEDHWLNTNNSWLNTHYTINGYGLATVVRNPRNFTTNFTYDSENLYPATVTNALSQTTTFSYDYLSGKMASQTDPNGGASNVVYDGLGRTIRQYAPHPDTGSATLLSTTSYFDTASPRYGTTSTTVNSVTSTSRGYRDGFAKPLQVWQSNEGSNNVTDFWYDENGRLEEQTLPYSSTASSWSGRNSTVPSATTTYDVVNRVLSQALPVGTTTYSATFDPWIQTVTDPNGNQKVYHHDPYGNIVLVQEITSSGTFSTTYDYDVRNLLTYHLDPQGNRQYFVYDSLGRKIIHEEPRRSWVSVDPEWQYTYDANGNALTVTRPDGGTTSYDYDSLDRVLNGDYFNDGTPDVLFTYDATTNGLGRLASVSRGPIITQYDYDKQGNVTEEAESIDSITYVSGSSYDLAGRPFLTDYPGPLTVNYSYNSLAALETVSSYWSSTPLVSDFDYSPAGQKTFMAYGNGVETTNTFVAAENYRLANKNTTGIFDSVPDADGDGFSDNEEVAIGSDPTSIDSTIYNNSTSSFPVSFSGFSNVALNASSQSLVTENPTYCIARGYTADKLVDGNHATLAYPARHEYYYEIDLGQPYALAGFLMKWGNFGHTTFTGYPTYLTSWKLTGITTAGQEITLANQLSPESNYSLVDVDPAMEGVLFETIRIHGWSTSNWIGLYELEAYGVSVDSDGDGLNDDDELSTYNTNPALFDTDANGLPDSIIQIHNTLSAYSPDPTPNTSLSYNGNAWIELLDPTISASDVHISNVEYAIDLGSSAATPWMTALASDGNFNGATENYEFTTPALSDGYHIVTTKVIANVVDTIVDPISGGPLVMTWVNDEITVDSSISSAPLPATAPPESEVSNAPGPPVLEESSPEEELSPPEDEISRPEDEPAKEESSPDESMPNSTPAIPTIDKGDKDLDGAPDDTDICENTLPLDDQDRVDENGCALSQLDSDDDGLSDYLEIVKYNTNPNSDDTDQNSDPNDPGDPNPEKTAFKWSNFIAAMIAIAVSIPIADASPINGNIQSLQYSYDSVGNITQISDTSITPTAKTISYGYDDRNFLTSAATNGFSAGDYTQTYAYDSISNLQYKSDVGTINHNGTGWPGPHAITSVGGDNYTYDVNGNLLFDGENTYTWTIRNELESVTNAGGTKIYTYDAFGRRAKSVFTPVATPENPAPSPQTTIYVSNLMEVREDGPLYYIYAGADRIASYTLYEGGTWRYYHSDHLSGTTLTTDEGGEVVQVLDYEPYGEQTLSLDYGTQGSPYSYTGKELDPSSNLYYYEARWYDPETGHFISTDPFPRRNPAYMIPDPARWNEYAYARGNPVNYNDPSGEGAVEALQGAIKTSALSYAFTSGNYYTGKFLSHSAQAKPADLFYGSNSGIATFIRNSGDYQSQLTSARNDILDGRLSGSFQIEFKEGDLETSLANVSFEWVATKNADGSHSIKVTSSDRYNFEFSIKDYEGDPTLNAINNSAAYLEAINVLNSFDIKITMDESYTTPAKKDQTGSQENNDPKKQ